MNRPIDASSGISWKVSAGYELGTTCYSSCYTGSEARSGTAKKIRCYRISFDPRDTAKWTPQPLICNAIACPSSEIYPVEHGRWTPDKCMVQHRLPYRTMCLLQCDQFYRRESEQFQTQCVEGGWTYKKSSFLCVMQDGIADYVGPVVESKDDSNSVVGSDKEEEFIDTVKDKDVSEMTDDDAEVQAGREWAAQDLRHRVKAAEEKHGRDKIAVESARKEERLKAEKQRLNTEKKARDEYLAKQKILNDWKAQHDAKAMAEYKNSQSHLKYDKEESGGDDSEHDSEREAMREGEEEISEGIETVIDSSTPMMIIVICTSILMTILGVVITACYYNKRNSTEYTLVNNQGEQLVPLT